MGIELIHELVLKDWIVRGCSSFSANLILFSPFFSSSFVSVGLSLCSLRCSFYEFDDETISYVGQCWVILNVSSICVRFYTGQLLVNFLIKNA